MSLVADSDRFYELLDPEVELEEIAAGFTFTEGPIWMADGSLHFSDMPADKRRRWHPEEGVSILRDPSNRCNGMTRDGEGNAYVCEHVTSSVVREGPDGSSTTIASHYQGKEINSPNDVIVAEDGSVIFTDPPFGRTIEAMGPIRELQLGFNGVFRVPPGGGDLQLLADDFEGPNGLCLSPDESLLYVNDSLRAHIRVFDVQPDFSLANDRIFAADIGDGELGGDGLVDGMKVDERGDVYVTGPRGIWVFSPEGEKLGEIHVSDEHVGNLNWGDEDWSSLYICASSKVYRLRTKVPGHRLSYMR